ncbi:M28 family metallopeptidase [Bacillus thuringiensis]|uniref:M28 family metallopeptidase n=1 Tax=Bacillus thuringiensis TaxID=1428 RepID=UPI000BF5CA85|nr:M28 family metallopeptidase [Bacillus thuringiensis]PES39789.1 Zn-dependent exopeptidase M28 [Bacillus thuringiensis]PFD59671.1 Zn-dependent exopeptidase M28 [Bacillus thuringiensis]PFS25327.1 Zn-dependent exopeptidase M28 [Bacillus thuringiensis]
MKTPIFPGGTNDPENELLVSGSFRNHSTTVNSIQSLVNQVSENQFQSYLTHLVSYPTRFSTSSFYEEAATWTREILKEMGYTTSSETIRVNNENSQNVIANKMGTNPDEEKHLIIITAHLDSVNHSGGPSSNAPGADDNGSGSAGVLEIARVFKDIPVQHDLRFILFGGEEQGLLGKQYVENLTTPDKNRIRAVINMDMIGKLNTSTPAVLIEGSPLSEELINGLKNVASLYTNLDVKVSLNPFDSDHVSFLNKGIPAVLTIEGEDSLNPNDHTANDTLEHIYYPLALDILRMNIAFIASQVTNLE